MDKKVKSLSGRKCSITRSAQLSSFVPVWLWRPLQSPHKRVSGERAVFLSARLLPFKYSLHSCMSPASALCHTTLKLSSSICLSIYLCLFTTEKYLYQSVHQPIYHFLTICPFTHLFIFNKNLFSIFYLYKASTHLFFRLSIHPSIVLLLFFILSLYHLFVLSFHLSVSYSYCIYLVYFLHICNKNPFIHLYF